MRGLSVFLGPLSATSPPLELATFLLSDAGHQTLPTVPKLQWSTLPPPPMVVAVVSPSTTPRAVGLKRPPSKAQGCRDGVGVPCPSLCSHREDMGQPLL
ncbi:hypothetical protein SKAU_G00098730 [Synaphobranchus kaupii]|uniref:Uncharacterized protein n=1 Tax=Synaphobranchus kaupii TaxID=118154 RepID=A0A9Q1FY42_SYNKA|nr:hypothetical protein SKAU_G00098730 [Synaphobranchus kaupii]